MRDTKDNNRRSNRNQEQVHLQPPARNDNNAQIAKRLLLQSGIQVSSETDQQLHHYVQLIREWNPFASLVSNKDLDLLEQTHVPDSLSLAPVIRRISEEPLRLLDIGSGGGLPAIPLKIVLPDLEVEMVERGAKKAGFLEKLIGALHLSNIRVIQGDFPNVEITPPAVITARAVEKPAKLLPHILDLVRSGASFLCQAPLPPLDDAFHVERVEDEWTASGLRRGNLFIIRRRPH